MPFTRKQWSIAANVLRFVGATSFLAAFASLLLLSVHLSTTRPRIPQPEFGRTVRLYWNWAPPTYGTVQDQARLHQLFYSLFPAFMLIAAGECIFIYKLNIDRSSVGRINLFPKSKG
jgi:hypothetical protein